MVVPVLVVPVTQDPEMEKQPAERSSPLLNVEVAPLDKRMLPPDIVKPEEVAARPGERRPE